MDALPKPIDMSPTRMTRFRLGVYKLSWVYVCLMHLAVVFIGLLALRNLWRTIVWAVLGDSYAMVFAFGFAALLQSWYCWNLAHGARKYAHRLSRARDGIVTVCEDEYERNQIHGYWLFRTVRAYNELQARLVERVGDYGLHGDSVPFRGDGRGLVREVADVRATLVDLVDAFLFSLRTRQPSCEDAVRPVPIDPAFLLTHQRIVATISEVHHLLSRTTG